MLQLSSRVGRLPSTRAQMSFINKLDKLETPAKVFPPQQKAIIQATTTLF